MCTMRSSTFLFLLRCFLFGKSNCSYVYRLFNNSTFSLTLSPLSQSHSLSSLLSDKSNFQNLKPVWVHFGSHVNVLLISTINFHRTILFQHKNGITLPLPITIQVQPTYSEHPSLTITPLCSRHFIADAPL